MCRIRQYALAVLVLSAALVAAQAGPGTGNGAVPGKGYSAGAIDEADRRRLFADLVTLVRRFHVFSPETERNLGRKWEDELPALEEEFARANNHDALIVALIHFGNTLHNPHCAFDPADKPTPLILDATADVEWKDGKPVFYVAVPPKDSAIVAGDIFEAVDGVPAAQFLERGLLNTNRNNWFGVAAALARRLAHRNSRTVAEGAHTMWTLRPRDGSGTKNIELVWHRPSSQTDQWNDYAVDYEKRSCGDLPPVEYGPYTLWAEGQNFCLYISPDARYRAYPIVRYFSFSYTRTMDESFAPVQHRVRADHDALLAGLSALKDAHAILLDLRNNGGGNNPNWVMDWFAPGPYTDQYVFTRLDDALREPSFLHDTNIEDEHERRFDLAELEVRAPGQAFARRRPLNCRPDTCDWDNRYVPSHRVTTLPLALLVGPGCVSACDTFTQQFDEFSFAPLIGEPTATGQTSRRLKRYVVFHGERLGTLEMAFSYEVGGRSGKRVEGEPIHLDERVDRTFENRGHYDALLVDHAIRALEKRKHP